MITLNRVGMHNNLRNNEYYCLAKDINNLPKDIMNGAVAHVIDYKAKKISKDWVFDKESGQWVEFMIPTGGGGEGGTLEYPQLNNKPSINGVTLVGDKTSEQLNIPTLEVIQQLEDGKANYTYKVIANDKVSQADAREILSDLGTYEGKLIEFLTNEDLPSKCVATGRVMTDKNGNSYLLTYNLDGTVTQWSKESFEKHFIESYNYTNQMVDLDSLTIDVQGQAPFVATVHDGFNKPKNTSNFGSVSVFAYNTEMQIQVYRDMETGYVYQRLITGQPNRHTFNPWKTVDNKNYWYN